MVDSPPTSIECARALEQAVMAQRRRAARRLRSSASPEWIAAIPTAPRPGRDGWWIVGHLFDESEAGRAYDVWYHRAQDATPAGSPSTPGAARACGAPLAVRNGVAPAERDAPS
jgi:hypothetical protein